MAEQTALRLCVDTDPETDSEDPTVLAGRLREWLRELDIESAEPATAGAAPPGTRGGEMFVAGALTVVLARSSELFTALIETVQSWLSRGGDPWKNDRE